MPEHKDFTVYRGTDQRLRFVMTTNGDVSTWQTEFAARKTIRSADPPAILLPGFVADPGSDTTPGVFEVVLDQASLLAVDVRLYAFTFSRTDLGDDAVLTEGTMRVKADILHEVPV